MFYHNSPLYVGMDKRIYGKQCFKSGYGCYNEISTLHLPVRGKPVGRIKCTEIVKDDTEADENFRPYKDKKMETEDKPFDGLPILEWKFKKKLAGDSVPSADELSAEVYKKENSKGEVNEDIRNDIE